MFVSQLLLGNIAASTRPASSDDSGRGRLTALERDGIRLNHHRALDSCLSMISAQTRCVCREGNRYTLFRIMLYRVTVLLRLTVPP